MSLCGPHSNSTPCLVHNWLWCFLLEKSIACKFLADFSFSSHDLQFMSFTPNPSSKLLCPLICSALLLFTCLPTLFSVPLLCSVPSISLVNNHCPVCLVYLLQASYLALTRREGPLPIYCPAKCMCTWLMVMLVYKELRTQVTLPLSALGTETRYEKQDIPRRLHALSWSKSKITD